MAVWTPVQSNWKLIFDDEFNGPDLNLSHWQPNWFGSTPTSITNPSNSSEIAAYDPAQVTIAGAHLQLTTKAGNVKTESGKSFSYSTGLVSSNGKFQFTYGYVEARVFCPGGSGKIANWPAFWCDGQNWPTDGELDVMEGLGGSAARHFHNPAGQQGGSVPGDFTGWHVYAAWWQNGKVQWFYDGKQVGQITSGVTNSPMYLILDNGMGQYGGPQLVPAAMQIDYVHVYTPDQSATAVPPEPGYGGPGDDGSGGGGTNASDTVLQKAIGKNLKWVVVTGLNPDNTRYLDATP